MQEYLDSLLIQTCLEIVEGGDHLKTSEIHYQLFDRFHARVANQAAHKRPDELLHPHKLLECTAFKSQKDWDAWNLANKWGSGKASDKDPDSGLLTADHAEYASRKWEKYKLLKREIHDAVQRLWIALVPNNVLPSGVQRINELVETLRRQMFDVWKFAKTCNSSKVVYADQEMVGPYANWHPTWWNVWRAMGPAAGLNCSATFMAEVGMKCVTTAVPLPPLLELHFSPSSGSANFALASKKTLQKELKERRDIEAGLVAPPALPATPASISFQSRVRSQDTKTFLDVRKHEIQRLEFLSTSTYASAKELEGYRRELFMFMQQPVICDPELVRSRTGTPHSGLDAANDSSASSTLGSKRRSALDSDAADVCFQGIAAPSPRKLAPLLENQMSAEENNDHGAAYFDHAEVEMAAMQGEDDDPSTPSNPVDAKAITPSNPNAEVLLLRAHWTPSDGSCCPNAILESFRCVRRYAADLVPREMPLHARELRESVCDWMADNADFAVECIGDQTFREGVRLVYVIGRSELRDSEYIKAAMEAVPQEDPVQRVSSFQGYLRAMRNRFAYGDEFFIAAASLLYGIQICVLRQFEEGAAWKPSFYSCSDPKLRIFLKAEDDHYEWCTPIDEDDPDQGPRISIPDWDPPRLKLEKDMAMALTPTAVAAAAPATAAVSALDVISVAAAIIAPSQDVAAAGQASKNAKTEAAVAAPASAVQSKANASAITGPLVGWFSHTAAPAVQLDKRKVKAAAAVSAPDVISVAAAIVAPSHDVAAAGQASKRAENDAAVAAAAPATAAVSAPDVISVAAAIIAPSQDVAAAGQASKNAKTEAAVAAPASAVQNKAFIYHASLSPSPPVSSPSKHPFKPIYKAFFEVTLPSFPFLAPVHLTRIFIAGNGQFCTDQMA